MRCRPPLLFAWAESILTAQGSQLLLQSIHYLTKGAESHG